MTTKQNLLTGTDEVQVTTANSATGGSAFSTVSGTIVYDTAEKMHGTTSARFAGGTVFEYISFSGFNTTQFGARAYVKFSALPTLHDQALVQVRSPTATTLNGFYLQNATGQFAILTPTGATYVVSPTSISLNTWYRIELTWDISPTAGSMNCRVYLGDSTSALWSVNPTNIDTGSTAIAEVRYGSLDSRVSASQFWVDEVAARDGSVLLIGPYTATAPTVNATASVVGTTISLGAQVSTFDGLAPSYLWSQTSGPTVTLSSTTSATPTVTSAPVGNYVFALRVTDSGGATASDTVAVTVTSGGGGGGTVPTAVVSMYHDVFVIDATHSTASAGGALSYSITPGAGLTALKPGLWAGLSPSTATAYTVQVTEVGATGPATSTVTVPAKPSSGTGSGMQILLATNDSSLGGTFV